jgi:lipoate---protein ligase
MNLIISRGSNPYENLAIEEFLLKYCEEDYLFLYINQPCVVIGKHQITQKEINSKYVFENNILVARRLSGGGAVFHDQENLNFSFICTTFPGDTISYKSITKSILEFLLQTGLDVEMSVRNDIMSNGKKISGSAMHIFKNRILAHGTILIDSNLTNLSQALKGHPERYTDKSIASKPAEIMNLSDFNRNLTAQYFLTSLTHFMEIEKGYHVMEIKGIPGNDIINQLISQKYSLEDWIYGYSPKYTYRSDIILDKIKIPYSLKVEKGIIEAISLDLTVELNNDIKLFMNKLRGEKHNYSSVNSLLSKEVNSNFNSEILLSLF